MQGLQYRLNKSSISYSRINPYIIRKYIRWVLLNFFRNPGGREDKAPTKEDAIQKLTETDELLKKRIDIEEKKVKQYLAIARQNGLENERGMISIINSVILF